MHSKSEPVPKCVLHKKSKSASFLSPRLGAVNHVNALRPLELDPNSNRSRKFFRNSRSDRTCIQFADSAASGVVMPCSRSWHGRGLWDSFGQGAFVEPHRTLSSSGSGRYRSQHEDQYRCECARNGSQHPFYGCEQFVLLRTFFTPVCHR